MYIITDVVYQCIDFVLPSVFKIVCIYDVSTEINIFWLWLDNICVFSILRQISASTTNRTRASFTCWHSKEEYVKINENFLTLDATATACSCSISLRVLITGKSHSKQQHSNVRDPFAYTCLCILLPSQQHRKLLIYTATIIRVWLRFWHHVICKSNNTSKCFLVGTLMTGVRGIVFLTKCDRI